MNIIVCIKRTPDTEARIKIGPDTKSIDTAGVKFILNPYDEFAIEEALQRKEKAGTGSVTVMTLGGDEAKETLRTALAMGADQAVLLKGAPSHDGLGTAEKLAEAIEGREYDLILFGKQSVDDDNLQVPAMVAELLGLPCATVVTELQIDGRKVKAKREVEGGHESVEFELPAVISAQKGLNEPRYASLKGIMSAKRKPLDEVDAADVSPATSVISLSLPPARPDGRILGEGAAAVDALIDVLRNEAKVL